MTKYKDGIQTCELIVWEYMWVFTPVTQVSNIWFSEAYVVESFFALFLFTGFLQPSILISLCPSCPCGDSRGSELWELSGRFFRFWIHGLYCGSSGLYSWSWTFNFYQIVYWWRYLEVCCSCGMLRNFSLTLPPPVHFRKLY